MLESCYPIYSLARIFGRLTTVVLLAALLLLLVSTALESSRAAAQDEAGEPFTGANIVFIVDQSGSMGGQRYGSGVHPEANDPDDRRFEVARFAIDFLAQLRYTYGPLSDRDWDINTAVVYFGDSVETPVRNLTIAPDSSEQWQTVWDDVEPLLSADSFGARNMGNTNIGAAVSEALAIQQEMSDESEGRRMRAIILVTDGLPVVVTGQRDDGSFVIEPWQDHMAKIQDQVSNLYSGQDDRFYVVALIDADPWWEEVERDWQQIVQGRGFAELVLRNEEVTGYVQRAINEIVDPFSCDAPGEQSCTELVTDTVKVLPYLNQITFILHKIRVEDEISFVSGGQALDLGAVNVTRVDQDRLVETITFRDPPPGIWDVVRPEGRRVAVYKYELLRPLFRFDLGGTEASLGCGRPVTLRVHFLRPGDLPVAEIPGYPVNVNLEIRWPAGIESWDMGRPDQPGLYEQREFVLGHGADAEVWLRAVSIDPENEPLVLFEGNVGSVSAAECRCEFLQPLPARIAQYDTFTPTLALVTDAGPLSLEVTGEYEIRLDLGLQGDGVVAAPVAMSTDTLSAAVSAQVLQCADFSLTPSLTLRDVQTGREKSICALQTQNVGVDCRTLVRMLPSPPANTNAQACNLLGKPSDFLWKIRLVDDQGGQLAAADALARADQLPFTAAISASGSVVTAEESWAPAQLPPAQSDYEWRVTNLAPGRYDVRLDFPSAVATGYVKDPAYVSYQSTLDLDAPDNLAIWRGLASAIAAGLLGLVGLLVYLFVIRPGLGPLPQGSLLMMKQGMEQYATLARSTIHLQPRKRQVVDAAQEAMLRDYCDRLEVAQDPDKWDRLVLTPVSSGSRRDVPLLMGGLADLDNRGSGPALNFEYKVDSFEQAQATAKQKRRSDGQRKRTTWIVTGVLALLAAVAAFLWLPLGC